MSMSRSTSGRDEVEDALDQRNVLLGVAAHDLRNPLDRIRACSDLLMADARDDLSQEQRELLMIIHARSRRLLEQVDAVLHGGALEDSRLDLTLAPVSLVPFVHHIVHLNTAMATAKDITLDMTTEGAEPRALIDAERLEQVLDTVIGDALDRTRAGGHVSVRVERTAQEAIVTVHDDGAAPLPRGLKVAIVERIVNGHGGRVEGRGATRGWRWQLTLPLLQGGGNDG